MSVYQFLIKRMHCYWKRKLLVRRNLLSYRWCEYTCGHFRPSWSPTSQIIYRFARIKKGDEFYIEVNGKTLAYQVDQIKTVEPTDTKDLHIESGQDLVTLLTCTPYMINSHRLLVRGHRIPYQPEKQQRGWKSGTTTKFTIMDITFNCLCVNY